ncbi:iron transporter FeoA [Zhengella mangrovi]|uniref:Iron transporter FeoA n=1 Tax=Zhengella mangrovi TaxID=1982044 RepID=A0A2G1QK68_9HYPH|nr:FeoA family protein [Zhengella mangrovi]PHP65933.1 iron transporter FeoA [Zhengella mangrovi]
MTTHGQFRLGQARRGQRGIIAAVGRSPGATNGRDEVFDVELERRLLEIGFVEGARVEVLHEGFLGRDPIAVKVDSMRVALRRHEADMILVREAPAQGPAGTAPR